MDLNEMTRKDFENLPLIEDDVVCDGLIFLPTKRKHESGYAMFHACPILEQKVLGKCEMDDIIHAGVDKDIVSVDCLYSSKLIRIQFTHYYKLKPALHWLEKGE